VTIALLVFGFLLLSVAVVAVRDLTQRQHAVTRNFPVIGHLRYLFEEMGQPLRQYFFAGDLEERPYNRVTRSWVYASAKGQNNMIGFGSQVDHNEPGRMQERDVQMITHACGLTHPSQLHRGRYRQLGSRELSGRLPARSAMPCKMKCSFQSESRSTLEWHIPT